MFYTLDIRVRDKIIKNKKNILYAQDMNLRN